MYNLVVEKWEEILNFFKNELENEEVLLFQYYETGNNDNVTQEDLDETFEYYCDDMIYYYNSDVKLKIEKEILKELAKETKDKETAPAQTRKPLELFMPEMSLSLL